MSEIRNGDIRIDTARREVFINDVKTSFTNKEYSLLLFFMENAGRVLSFREILKNVWGPAYVDEVSYLRIYISQIRTIIGDEPSAPKYIVTHKGIGYFMEKHDYELPPHYLSWTGYEYLTRDQVIHIATTMMREMGLQCATVKNRLCHVFFQQSTTGNIAVCDIKKDMNETHTFTEVPA